MQKWDIARPSGVCAVSGRPLLDGEEYYVVLFEEGDSFRRADYSVQAWSGTPDGAFCTFKSRMAVSKPKRRLFVDDDLLINFFLRLAEETDAARLRFRFVLALILMRKRLLRYEDCLRGQGSEHWRMRLVKDQSTHQVLNPQMTDDQIEGVSRELGSILHGDVGEFGEDGEAWPDQPTQHEEAGDA